jgi:NAD(P)-dependent dehydrogenase (short-subunit alcohol dehydrogenase family)
MSPYISNTNRKYKIISHSKLIQTLFTFGVKEIFMNILVNGGTKGIGREIVIFFANDQNNRIIATGRDAGSLKALSEKHANVYPYQLDLTAFESQGSSFRDWISAGFGNVDILINTAGLLVAKDFVETTYDDARLMMETNFFGPASLIRGIRPLMPSGSHIVNISSMGGFQGSAKYRGLSYYSASKAALSCLTECLAVEFTDFGISVNCLALGAVQTDMLNEAFPGYKAPVEPKQMAEFIAGFALTGNKYFNGKILPVAVGNP